MAVATSPTLTSTSHTLTGTAMPSTRSGRVSNGLDEVAALEGVQALLASLQPANRHQFLEPAASIPSESLAAVKDTLEGFAADVSELQAESNKKKRKRGDAQTEVLKLRKVHVDGFETGQVWQQAKKIIHSVLGFAGGVVDELEEKGEVRKVLEVQFGEDGFEVGSDDGEDAVSAEEDEEEDEIDEEEGESEEVDEIDGAEEEIEEEVPSDEEEEDDEEDGGDFVEDPNGLNDGFFSIEDFNRQTQWFEEQDARGDPNTDQASDDDEVDWTANPFAPSSTNKSKPTEVDEEEDEDDEDGPTFGNMALDAPEGESDDEDMDEEDGDEGMGNANDVFYKDFFAPPPRKNSKPRKPKQAEPKPTEQDMERAMADVKRDLFDDESDMGSDEDALSEVDAGDPKSRRSAHERRQAKLADEIRKLEAASVAKREWTLSGEAAAVDRPMNSLLEEDLDFEHLGKPVPVITPEVSETIEELIKRRILSQEFDEVLRRRPDTDSVPQGTRRGLVDVDDSKPGKSLAEVYEEEHVKANNPDSYTSQSDEKLRKEEQEVESLWKDVCARLDSLSSWHYKPKPSAPTLSVVSDVATVAMEDAQPTTAQAIDGSSRMAPQEVYTPGKGGKDEVVTKGGMPLARGEMSREEKTRRRRRHKERLRKGEAQPAKVGSRAKMQRDTMAQLKKGGVKVINRKGEVTDVDGNKTKSAKVVTSGALKL